VICHHRVAGSEFAADADLAAEELLPAPWGRLDRLAYRWGRATIPPATSALARHIQERGARLLHFHYLTDARFFLALKRKTGLPAVASAYGYDVSRFPHQWGGLGRAYLAPIFGALDLFLAMSEDMRRDLVDIGCPEEKIRVHYYGTDTRRFRYPERSYAPPGPPLVLCCGTLEIKKAQHLVLRALRRVEQLGVADFRVALLGDGPLRPEIERLIGEYGWGDRVTLAGHVPYAGAEHLGWYRRADIFALPSITVRGDKEGIPGVIVEAMAAGLPVIGSYHAGIPAAIEAGKSGLLVPEGDVEALADAFARLLTDDALRERLGRAAARRAAQGLDLYAGTAALERMYGELLEARACAA
jgi:colanic acid/amylovoran biosynthesis glycosyltransferase